jgi:hypothetical protein
MCASRPAHNFGCSLRLRASAVRLGFRLKARFPSRFVILWQVASRNLQALDGSLPSEGCLARLAAFSYTKTQRTKRERRRKLERLPAGVSLSVRFFALLLGLGLL